MSLDDVDDADDVDNEDDENDEDLADEDILEDYFTQEDLDFIVNDEEDCFIEESGQYIDHVWPQFDTNGICAICHSQKIDEAIYTTASITSCEHSFCFMCAYAHSFTSHHCPVCDAKFHFIQHKLCSRCDFETSTVDNFPVCHTEHVVLGRHRVHALDSQSNASFSTEYRDNDNHGYLDEDSSNFLETIKQPDRMISFLSKSNKLQIIPPERPKQRILSCYVCFKPYDYISPHQTGLSSTVEDPLPITQNHSPTSTELLKGFGERCVNCPAFIHSYCLKTPTPSLEINPGSSGWRCGSCVASIRLDTLLNSKAKDSNSLKNIRLTASQLDLMERQKKRIALLRRSRHRTPLMASFSHPSDGLPQVSPEKKNCVSSKICTPSNLKNSNLERLKNDSCKPETQRPTKPFLSPPKVPTLKSLTALAQPLKHASISMEQTKQLILQYESKFKSRFAEKLKAKEILLQKQKLIRESNEIRIKELTSAIPAAKNTNQENTKIRLELYENSPNQALLTSYDLEQSILVEERKKLPPNQPSFHSMYQEYSRNLIKFMIKYALVEPPSGLDVPKYISSVRCEEAQVKERAQESGSWKPITKKNECLTISSHDLWTKHLSRKPRSLPQNIVQCNDVPPSLNLQLIQTSNEINSDSIHQSKDKARQEHFKLHQFSNITSSNSTMYHREISEYVFRLFRKFNETHNKMKLDYIPEKAVAMVTKEWNGLVEKQQKLPDFKKWLFHPKRDKALLLLFEKYEARAELHKNMSK